MSTKKWPTEECSLAEIFLDQENIRTPISQKDQNALIQDLFENENAFDIAKSYSRYGVYPDEFPIGIRVNGKIIVIEGNRRVAALKALDEPDLIPSYTDRLRKLENPGIELLELVMAPSREAATHHIANKHTTNQRRPWKLLRQAYFYKTQLDSGKTIEQLIEKYPEQDIPQFIRMLEMRKVAKATPVKDVLREKVDDERNSSASTYARMYEHPVVKKFLGIDFDKQGRLTGKVDIEEFKKGNQKILEDIASGTITSRTSNSKEDVSKLLEKFPKKNIPDLSKKSEFTTDDFATHADNVGSTSKSVLSKQIDTTRRMPTTKSSPKVLFRKKEVPFNISSSPLKAMYEELRTIDIVRFPNATHDLIRSFLECSLCVYLKEVNQYEKVKARKKGRV